VRKLLSILLVLALLEQSRASLQFSVTTNVMIIGTYDSFDEGQAGNGHWCDDEAALQLGDPLHMYRARMASQAGQNNWGFVTNNLPAVALPLAGSMHGTNDVWFWLGVSGNGGFASTANSNWYTTNILLELQFPITNWTVNGYFTNDWPWTTNNLHWTVFGDSTYFGDISGNASVYSYSYFASNAANLRGVPFIDSTLHTSYETNVYATNVTIAQQQYYTAAVTPPDFSHPSRENFQFIRHLLDYQQLGGKTNMWSWVQDWNSASVASTATNGIAVTGISKTSSSYSGTIKADCLGGPIEIGDATHTNNNLKAFAMLPSLTNFFGEWIVFSNAPAGSFVWRVDGTPVMTNTSVNGMLSNNFYHTYCGPWFLQKMAVLDGYRTVRDISTTNAAVYVSQTYQKNFNSQVGTYWPTNGGTAAYTASMQSFENVMEAVDAAIFAAAQQTNHTFSVTLVQPIFAPFHR
jgi:hypothetical protein